jgi:UDPglucose 6-dehydrogenase
MGTTIGVIGLWHLGCVISAVWSGLGKRALGFDYDSNRVENLNNGVPPLFESNLQEKIQYGLNKKLLSFSNDIQSLSESDVLFLSYDTPVLDDDSSNTSILERSISDVAQVMKDGSIIIVSSQSPIGFCSLLREMLQEVNPTLELAYSPENLRLGEAIDCYLNPGRIILGTASKISENVCIDLFKEITDEILTMSLESAEMVKHGINSFLAMSIVFANNLADLCEETNARIDDVVAGMKSDPRVGRNAYLSPGIGFSGGTLGRDLKAMIGVHDQPDGHASLFSTIYSLNEKRKHIIVRKIEYILGGLKKKTVGILGLTYKPGTSTLRRSLPLEIANIFIDSGANVQAFDPKADYSELPDGRDFLLAKSIEEVARNADILLLLVEWPEFKDCKEWESIVIQMTKPNFFDAKNLFSDEEMSHYGFTYYSIGR